MATDEKKTIWESPILRTAALIGALVLITTQLQNLVVKTNEINPDFYKIILAGLNAIVLLTYCLISQKTPNLQFNKESNGKDEYSKSFRLLNEELNKEDAIKLAEKNNERVNLLAKQLNKNILYFALLLSITYICYIFDDRNSVAIANGKAGQQQMDSISFFFQITEDISNFISSVFLYLAFKVLYDKTLENDEHNSKYNYYMDAINVSGLYILAYIFFVIAKVNVPKDTTIVANIFSLLSGLFNGLAMTLLFARYISMEHSVSKIDKIKYSDIISLLTIFLLPLYTLAQPLFGTFKIEAFGDAQTFQNYVFLVCLLGKIFFLFMTFYFLKRKLVHLYMHMVLTRHDSANKIADCFKIET